MTDFTANEITEIFSKYGNIGNLVNQFRFGEAAIPGFSNALDAVLNPLLNFSFSGQHFVVGANADGNPTVSFTLPDHSVLGFILDPDILKKIEEGDEDCLFALDYLPAPGLFSDMFRGTPFDGLAPSSGEFVVSTKFVTSLGGAELDSGISLVSGFDLSSSTNPVLHFANEYLHVEALQAIANVGLEHQSLAGNVLLHDVGFSVGEFGYSFESFNFEIAQEGGEPVFTAGAASLFSGYDPFQTGEPDLLLSGGFKIDPTSLTLFGQVDADGWHNPFGLPDVTIRSLGLQLGGTYVTPFLDNMGFILDMKLGQYDYDMVLAFDLTTPAKNAIELTLNEPANVARLFADIAAINLFGPGAIELTSLLAPLFKHLPLTLESFDSDGDGELDPLVMAVPFETEIGGVRLEPGFGVNALVRLAGAKGSLALNASEDFKEMTGSLEIDQISLGNFLTIGGVRDGDPLTMAFDISPATAQQSMSGNGKISVFGFDIVQADFAFSIQGVRVEDTFIDLGIGRLVIDELNIDPTAITASGRGNITVLDTQIAGAAFTLNSHELTFAGKVGVPGVVELDANFAWNDVSHELHGTGALKIGGTTIPSGSILVKSDGSTLISGALDISVQGLGHFNAELDITFSNHAYSLSIDVEVPGLGPIKFGLAIDDNMIHAIENKIEDLVVGGIGEQVIWVANAIASGAADAFSAGNFNYIGSEIDHFFSSTLGAIGDAIDRLFGHSREKNQTFIGDDGDDHWDGNGGNDAIFGNGGRDILGGHQGNDAMDGGAGDDALYNGSDNDLANGGDGDDLVAGDGGADTLYGGFGNDLLFGDSSVDRNDNGKNQSGYRPGNDVLHGGPGDDALYGGVADDLIYGDDGNDFLEGGPGLNTLYGGAGDDTYDISNSDIVIENPNEGIDTIRALGSYILPAEIENLVVQAVSTSGTTYGTGNNLDNRLIGGSGDDVLAGLGGNDTLDGGLGDDTLEGGTGNDTYIVRVGTALILEDANAGTDTVQTSLQSYTLGNNVENLIYNSALSVVAIPGPTPFTGTGNALNNAIIGGTGDDTLSGDNGDDALDGGAGMDRLMGGNGQDSYFVDNAGDVIVEAGGPLGGIDTVNSSALTYTLADNVENLTLIGAAAIDGTGNSLGNVIDGNAGANTLDGAGGNDTLAGGGGNDTYLVDPGDTVVELANAGIDTVIAGLTYTLGANLEKLILSGAAAIDGTGNDLANVLNGNSANNRLEGGKGDDTLDGGEGADTLIGGDGSDTYVIDGADDVIVEAGIRATDSDTVVSAFSYTLGATIENLILSGASAINGTGNNSANAITGNSANNRLEAAKGDDTLDGGAGTDTLIGGEGNDTYLIDSSDTLVEAANQGRDTIVAGFTHTLAAGFENLILSGTGAMDGTGNDADNVLTGNGADNRLEGGKGADTLNGGAGADTLVGGEGNDTYIIDASDTLVEAGDQGIDTVIAGFTYTLAANIENLTLGDNLLTPGSSLTGAGNALDNVLTDNAGVSQLYGLAGNDTLHGGGHSDLYGGDGNDTYVVQSPADIVHEAAGALAGTDTIVASFSSVLIANVENLTLSGIAAISGTGNSDSNVITGNAAANTLDGGDGNDFLTGMGGDDTLLGGAGDDTLVGGEGLDLIIGNDGFDTAIFAGNGADYTVTVGPTSVLVTRIGGPTDELRGIERLLFNDQLIDPGAGSNQTIVATPPLPGSTGSALRGGDGDDTLLGNTGADTLMGGLGADTLTGGTGVDSFTGTAAGLNGDRITDYQVGETINVLGESFIADDITLTRGSTIIDIDLDGDSVSDLTITLALDLPVLLAMGVHLQVTPTPGGMSVSFVPNIPGVTLQGSPWGGSTLTGTVGDDVLWGQGWGNAITGMDGSDTIVGGQGGAMVDGGAGNDFITIAGWNNRVVGGAGSDVIDAGQGNAWVDGGTGNDRITVAGWNNIIFGGAGSDIIDAGQGNATVDAGPGNNSITVHGWNNIIKAGAGNDFVQGVDGNSSFDLGHGNNTIQSWGWNNVVKLGNGNNLIQDFDGNGNITAGDGANTIGLQGWNNALSLGDGNNDVTVLVGGHTAITAGDGDNVLRLSGWSNVVHLGNGDNVVFAGMGISTITTGSGNDVVMLGGSGPSTVSTGDGDDTIYNGGSHSDWLSGGRGDDTYQVNNATTIIVEDAGEGYDIAYVGVDGYVMSANVEVGRLFGAASQLTGGTGADNLVANGALGSRLEGDGGDDVLWGSNLADVFIGGAANDLMMGYGGADRFVFSAPGWGADQIVGFSSAEGDQIDLRGLGLSSIAELDMVSGANTQITYGGSSIYLFGVGGLAGSDFIFQ